MDWNNLYKIKIRSHEDAFMKHEVTKLLVVKNLLLKYKKEKKYVEIYTEFPISQGKVCDVFFQNNKTKEAYAYELQTRVSKEWMDTTKKLYEAYSKEIKTFDWILIDLNKLSNDLTELNKQIKELIV